MRSDPVFYVQQDPSFALTAQPEIQSIRQLADKAIGVNAPTDAMGMSAKLILKGNGVDPSKVTFLTTQVTENAYKALLAKRIAATLLPPPFADEAEAKGYSRLAEAKDHAPLSTIGLVTSVQTLEKKPGTVQAVIRALLKTMAYLRNPENRTETVEYVSNSFKIARSVAEKALASMLTTYSADGTKPRAAIEREIEIYRDTLQVAKPFRAGRPRGHEHPEEASVGVRRSLVRQTGAGWMRGDPIGATAPCADMPGSDN